MRRETIKQYGTIRLLNIECSELYDWEERDATHIRVSVPPTYKNTVEMQERGFFLADRSLDVSINLAHTNVDYGKLVRIRPTVASDRKDEIMAIARQSFPTDRRFHVSVEPNPAIAAAVLAGWMKELDQVYFSEIKGMAVGFLALTGSDDCRFVHLAAVLHRYRVTGAGISLYATAAQDCKEAGVKFLNGRISSSNTAVMNLYAILGASFSNPLDIFLKENELHTEG